MTEYDNRNTGALFNNDKKEKPTHPDMRGSSTIVSPSGEVFEVWTSGWIKRSKAGQEFISLAFTLKDAAAGQQASAASPSTLSGRFGSGGNTNSTTGTRVVPELDDEVPF